MKNLAIFFIIFQMFAGQAIAQNLSQAQQAKTIRRNTAAVIFSSIGGAVLGLSTLSFYGRPQEHTDNITLGAAIGFIAGLTYVINTPTVQKIETMDFSKIPKKEIDPSRESYSQKSRNDQPAQVTLVQWNKQF